MPAAQFIRRQSSGLCVVAADQPDPATHAPEEYQLRLDVSKAANLLGWRCRLSMDTALQWVAGWYRSFHDEVDAPSLCMDQIDRYLKYVYAASKGSTA